MVNVNVSHLKERWRFVTKFRLWFLNTRLQLPLRSSISMAGRCTHSLVRAQAPRRDLLLFLLFVVIFTLNSKLICGTRVPSSHFSKPWWDWIMNRRLKVKQSVVESLSRGGLCPPSEGFSVSSCSLWCWQTIRQWACFESDRAPWYWSSCELNRKKNTPENPCPPVALVKPGRPLEEAVAWGSLVKNTLRSQGLYISTHNCATTIL